jgi:Carboxypeptidase regulatory-like domain/TonB dependent receptor
MRAIALFLTCFGLILQAQDTGWITGSVSDPTGAAVPKATVNLLLHGGTKPVAATMTTAQGLFTLQTLRPVYYDLTVDAPGFQQYKLENVKVDASRPTDLPGIKMILAAAASSVNVTAGLETVQTTSPAISTTMTAEQIERLPVGDRNPLAFISTQAGVSPGNANGYETDINGQRSSFSNVTLDGINIQDNYIRTGGLDFVPNEPLLSQIQEFTIITSNQGAGSSGGASQVNFTTPSGTNQYHGYALWQNRNNDFAANDFFDNQEGNPLPRLNLNQVATNVGGPIKKDKLFFYAAYELYRNRSQYSADQTILTSSARQGIFSYLNPAGQVQQVNVLATEGLTMDPVMSALLAQVPGPQFINNFRVGDSQPGQLLNTAGYGFLVRDNQERDNATGKLDYYITPKNSLTATYAWNRDKDDRPDIGVGYSSTPPIQSNDARNLLAVAWRTNPGSNFTNEVRAGMNIAPATFGYTGSGPGPYFIGGMIYSTPDPLAAASVLAQGRNTRTYSIQDNATWTHGRHTLKFGAFYQGVYVRTYDYTGTVPSYNVGISSTNQTQNLLSSSYLPGASLLDLSNANLLLASLAGLLDNDNTTFNVNSRTSGFVAGAPYLRHFTYNNLAFYGQDEWKILPRLTLTGSLRWDYYSPVNERDALEFEPVLTGTPEQTLLNPNAQLNFAGNSVGRPFYNKDLNNFAPSVGLAWDPFGHGTTSVRAGYGISYVTDEAIQVAETFTGTNPGLASYIANYNLSGFMGQGLPGIPAPPFQAPLSFASGYQQNSEVYYGMVNPNLRTPYVQEWNLNIQHEIKNTIIEARYVGNHAVKLLRGFDYNQEQIPANFMTDFLKAQQNGFLAQAANPAGGFNPAYNRNIPGSQPLPVFNNIGGPGQGGFLSNGTIQSDIQTGQVADLGALYQVNGLLGPGTSDPGLSFFPNPNALGSTYLTNFSNSTYNSLQLEARHRFANGLEFQANYSFEKWLSDAAGVYQNRFEPFMDINNTAIERARTPTDLTHQFKANYSYDLPFGEGHRIHGRFWDKIIGGWMTSGNITWTSGNPFSIYSGLGTFLSAGLGSPQVAGDSINNEAIALETMSQLNNQIQFRMTGNGPYIVPASATGFDGRGVAPPGQAAFAGQLFYNPGPGQLGTLQKRVFDGPPIFDMDAKLAKTIKVKERVSMRLFIEALNVFNHPNYFVGDQDINSQQFGKVTSTASYLPRQIQLGLKIAF